MSEGTPRKQYVSPAHFCAACRAEGKTWEGSDPKCAFQHGKPFSAENWNCATAAAVRDLIGRYHEKPREGIQREYSDDQTYATILVHDVELPGETYAWCLWVTWYKSRGRTGAMWLLDDEDGGPPRAPTEGDLIAILDHYDPGCQPNPNDPNSFEHYAEMEAIRETFMSAAVEVEPGVHEITLGANLGPGECICIKCGQRQEPPKSDDDIPF